MTLTLLAAAAFLAWLHLLFFRGGFWRASERLEPVRAPASWPPVVAIVPARNEAEIIAAVLRAHFASDYEGEFHVILVDDASTDGTADLARAAVQSTARLDVVGARPLTSGWTGKLNAVDCGIAEAKRAHAEARYLLLCDADIVLGQTTLRRLVAKAEQENLALVSLMSRLDARGFWGGLLMPAFVFFFQKLYPFPLSNDPASRVAAAAGGCMVVRRDALERAGGIAAIKGALIDDCALARLLKRDGNRIWIGLADDEAVSLRDNRALSSIHAMVARTAFTQLDHSWALLLGCVLGMALLYLAPAAIALSFPLHRNDAAGALALAALLAMSLAYFPTARLYGLDGFTTFGLPLAAAIYMAMTVSSAVAHGRGAGGLWKGRAYP